MIKRKRSDESLWQIQFASNFSAQQAENALIPYLNLTLIDPNTIEVSVDPQMTTDILYRIFSPYGRIVDMQRVARISPYRTRE